MTRLGGIGDDRPNGPGDDLLAVARGIADAVDALATLWAVAAQGASLRLSPHQLRALRILEAEPGLNLTALAEGMEIGPPTASRLCDRLEAAGLLERLLHPHKRREVQLVLTGRGRQVLSEVAERRAQALAAVLAGMDPAAREALSRGMRAFLTAQGGTGTRTDGPLP
ncbi:MULTISPECIES: MarR family winged helix-turn-helix transcriptional regulator [Streptomyces]|uniref:MarR family winged helix-turn-helix transcriptional regulator n=1 Tax=Streptomyces TaxID=1883 RepID=UPI0016723D23|nr:MULTISPECIES: MarR family transcriptional regulator [Streptomyces]MBK3520834.1 MarR family transcriptional regulator [Streptomyces sp. MBT70]